MLGCSIKYVNLLFQKMFSKEKSPGQLALDHFDRYYTGMYGSKWPSIRLALLSPQKYAALVNNFAETDSAMLKLVDEEESFDFIATARDCPFKAPIDPEPKIICEPELDPSDDIFNPNESSNAYETENRLGTSRLHEFMPVTNIHYSENELLFEREIEQSEYSQVGNTRFRMETYPDLQLPSHLKANVHDRGIIRRFRPAKRDSSEKLTYYCMDAAAILPVLALNLQPDVSMLDVCAAPGGKTLAAIQTLLPAQITCIDASWARLQRLKEILKWYAPKSYGEKSRTNIRKGNAIDILSDPAEHAAYDRVLVDVPCFTDRHSLVEEENNIFLPGRREERLNMQHLQKDLLVSGIKACKPGGIIVYSTCTLSMPQNDGVISRALDYIWQETDIELAIKDTAGMRDQFKDVFDFHYTTRHGSLVIPNVTANFGPMYFCVIQRVK